jgi:hypothetical protein
MLEPIKLLRSFIKTRSLLLATFAFLYEIMGHEWSGGELVCPHKVYSLTIKHIVKGRVVGELKIRTCVSCDPFM